MSTELKKSRKKGRKIEMKEWISKYKWVICISILIGMLIVASALCIVFANRMSSNTSSVVGGVLSVVGTTILGMIAFWQNKRYKELSDSKDSKIEQLTITPECRLLSVSQRVEGRGYQIACPDMKDSGQQYYLSFVSLNLPMIDVTVHEIKYYSWADKTKMDIFQHTQLAFNYLNFTVLQSYSNFTIRTTVPSKYNSINVICEIVLKYKNIYDTEFKKTFRIERQSGQADVQILSQGRAHI